MARHEAISKIRWVAAQKAAAGYWRGTDVLQTKSEHFRNRLEPFFTRWSEQLGDDATVLDVCCGPMCLARFIERGRKTYVDPLLDEFRRAYPAELPEGELLVCPAENISLPDASFDMIVCCDALDQTLNPELALNEIERLLKPAGVFILAIDVHHPLAARLRYYVERFFPRWRNEVKPYAYCMHGLRRTLERHFVIVEAVSDPPDCGLFDVQESVFVCRHRDRS